MMRKFVHKTLWWIAKPAQDNDLRLEEKLVDKYDIFAFTDNSYINNQRILKEELIELWFEEEKDWIDEVYKALEKDYAWCFSYTEWVEHLREAIEKNQPKTRKFTKEEVYKFRDSFSWTFMLYDFLKLHWLLEE